MITCTHTHISHVYIKYILVHVHIKAWLTYQIDVWYMLVTLEDLSHVYMFFHDVEEQGVPFSVITSTKALGRREDWNLWGIRPTSVTKSPGQRDAMERASGNVAGWKIPPNQIWRFIDGENHLCFFGVSIAIFDHVWLPEGNGILTFQYLIVLSRCFVVPHMAVWSGRLGGVVSSKGSNSRVRPEGHTSVTVDPPWLGSSHQPFWCSIVSAAAGFILLVASPSLLRTNLSFFMDFTVMTQNHAKSCPHRQVEGVAPSCYRHGLHVLWGAAGRVGFTALNIGKAGDHGLSIF